jgi:hypothetical protein
MGRIDRMTTLALGDGHRVIPAIAVGFHPVKSCHPVAFVVAVAVVVVFAAVGPVAVVLLFWLVLCPVPVVLVLVLAPVLVV